MAKYYRVKLTGAASHRRAGFRSWTKNQTRDYASNDPRVEYYRGVSTFDVQEFERKEPVPEPKAKPEPKKVEDNPKTDEEPSEGKEEKGEEPSDSPDADDAPPLDDVDALKADGELQQMLKEDLVEYAKSIGLDHVDDTMTKKEIRADVDSLR